MQKPELFTALQAPFPENEIIWKVGARSDDGMLGKALPHLDARHIQARLDETVGPCNWQDEYFEVITGSRLLAVRCRLTLVIDGQRYFKEDAAYLKGTASSEADRELDVKGVYSNALKRAAVKWGIGRYLYAFKAPWVPLVDGRFAERPSLALANSPEEAAGTAEETAVELAPPMVPSGAEAPSEQSAVSSASNVSQTSSVEAHIPASTNPEAPTPAPEPPASIPETPAQPPAPAASPAPAAEMAPEVAAAPVPSAVAATAAPAGAKSATYLGLLKKLEEGQVALDALLTYAQTTGRKKMYAGEADDLIERIRKKMIPTAA